MAKVKKKQPEKTEDKTPAGKAGALKNAEHEAIITLENALDKLNALSKLRTDCKMSNSRVTGVAKELKELIKVMSAYI